MRVGLGQSNSRVLRRGGVARLTAVVLVATLLAGCHARQRMNIPSGPPMRPDATTVQPGDRVRVRFESGTTVSFTVAEVRPDSLVGTKGQHVAYGSMTKLERTHFAAGRTIVLVVGGLALLVMAMTAAAYASFASGL